jgi:hypothetical protein
MMSDTGQDTPAGVTKEPTERSEEERELAGRLVAEANEQGLDLAGPDRGPHGPDQAGARGRSDPELTEHWLRQGRGRGP